ncbi:MAG: hypothetical protein ACOWWH_12520 [Eubacteriaceae bacterium]
MEKLFNIPEYKNNKTCRSCKHREIWQVNTKTIQYCGLRKSNRTFNNKLKINCKMTACKFYEYEIHNNKAF